MKLFLFVDGRGKESRDENREEIRIIDSAGYWDCKVCSRKIRKAESKDILYTCELRMHHYVIIKINDIL